MDDFQKKSFFFRIAELKRHAIIRLIQFFVNWWKKAEAVVCLVGCVHARERGLLRVAAYCMLVKISVSCEKGDVNSVVTTCLLDSLLNDTLQEFSFPFFFQNKSFQWSIKHCLNCFYLIFFFNWQKF